MWSKFTEWVRSVRHRLHHRRKVKQTKKTLIEFIEAQKSHLNGKHHKDQAEVWKASFEGTSIRWAYINDYPWSIFYFSPFVFYYNNDVFASKTSVYVGVVLDKDKFDLDIVKGWIFNEPESLDADWLLTDIPYGKDPWFEVLPSFLADIRSMLDRTREEIKFRRKEQRQNQMEQVTSRLCRLLGESRLDLPDSEYHSCPTCGSALLIPREHGKILYCTNCSEEFVYVEGSGLEKIQGLLL